MLDWRDPDVVLMCERVFSYSVTAVWGLYIWEFLVSIPFDLRGSRKFRWTFLPYLGSRYSILAALTIAVRMFWVFGESVNCHQLELTLYAFAHLAVIFSSLLILLRVAAVANNLPKYIIIALSVFYVCNVGGLIYGITQADATYVPELHMCSARHTVSSRYNMSISFVFDMACLGVMLVALLRMRGGNLWKYLISQGLIYMVVIAGAYLPGVIFLFLDLNDAMNELPQGFAVTVLALTATRMYRELSNYVSSDTPSTTLASGTTLSWRSNPSSARRAKQFARRAQGAAGPEISIDVNTIAMDNRGHVQDAEMFPTGKPNAAHLDRGSSDVFPVSKNDR
ncbi:hypothetical protein BKA62DRAFT_685793 [Auriculariales sp. MPI-PUGE-AT-0066]|nr:hypothetical protein BKA62DRAFT_685793 [Auriculariales sp. MPI-PUGE-AT-0066]